MKENSYEESMRDMDEDKINYQEILFKYIIHWPWFIVSVVDCRLGVSVFPDSGISDFCFYHD